MLKNPFADRLWLGVAACFVFILGLGGGSLASWDEAYYALVSHDIFKSHDWVQLTYFGNPFYDKPPLYMWLTALSYHIFGVSEFATRLPSAICGVGCILLTYQLGKTLFDRKTGFVAAVVLLTSKDFIHYARFGTLDITTIFLMSLMLYCYIRSWKSEKWWVGFFIFSALAFMTKGPLMVLPVGVVGLHSLFTMRFSYLKSRWFWGGMLLFALLILPWHLAAYHANPARFWKDFVVKHYIERTSQGIEGHAAPWWYYIRTFVNKHHPWMILFPAAFIQILWSSHKQKSKELLLVVLWMAVFFVFFSFIVATKLRWYILPFYIGSSLAIGYCLTTWIKKENLLKRSALIATVIIPLCYIGSSSVYGNDHSFNLKASAPKVQKMIAPGETVYLYNYHEEPAALFYLDRMVEYVDSLDELDKRNSQIGPITLILNRQSLEMLKNDLEGRGYRFTGLAGELHLAAMER